MTAQDWAGARTVLAVRLDALGDVLMTSPAIRALKESQPERRVTLLTSPAGAAVAPLLPEIDDTLVFEAPWLKSGAEQAGGPTRALVDELRTRSFDAAAIFTVYSQSPLPAAMLCFLADIPRRLAHCRENPYQLLTHWVAETEPERQVRHEVRRQLDLVATVGCRAMDERLCLRLVEDDRRAARAAVAASGICLERPWVALHPGASAPSRRYPPELFARAASRLAASGVQVLLVGEGSERAVVEAVRGAMTGPAASIIGGLTVAHFAALIEAAPVLIANNSGPAHLAAAVGTPVVDLYALTNPQHTPWAVPNRTLSHDVPCRNCYQSVCPHGHNHCLTLIAPEQVYEAAIELLEVRSTARAGAS